MKLNRAQRVALKAKFDQQPIWITDHIRPGYGELRQSTYREFRRTVYPLLGGGGCAMVPWCGMQIGIELDGHTHS